MTIQEIILRVFSALHFNFRIVRQRPFCNARNAAGGISTPIKVFVPPVYRAEIENFISLFVKV